MYAKFCHYPSETLLYLCVVVVLLLPLPRKKKNRSRWWNSIRTVTKYIKNNNKQKWRIQKKKRPNFDKISYHVFCCYNWLSALSAMSALQKVFINISFSSKNSVIHIIIPVLCMCMSIILFFHFWICFVFLFPKKFKERKHMQHPIRLINQKPEAPLTQGVKGFPYETPSLKSFGNLVVLTQEQPWKHTPNFCWSSFFFTLASLQCASVDASSNRWIV